MRFNAFLMLLTIWAVVVVAAKTSATTTTLVWVTVTKAGVLTTMQTPFKQEFMSTYTTAETSDVKSGQIGLGSLSGHVGDIRTYERTTISANEGILNAGSTSVLMGIAVVLGMVI